MKHLTNFRLSDEARHLLEHFAQVRGLTRTAMLEMLIRQYAQAQEDDVVRQQMWIRQLTAKEEHTRCVPPSMP